MHEQNVPYYTQLQEIILVVICYIIVFFHHLCCHTHTFVPVLSVDSVMVTTLAHVTNTLSYLKPFLKITLTSLQINVCQFR
jgi:hypothetical protein